MNDNDRLRTEKGLKRRRSFQSLFSNHFQTPMCGKRSNLPYVKIPQIEMIFNSVKRKKPQN